MIKQQDFKESRIKVFDLVLLTEPRYLEAAGVKDNAQNAILEDQILQEALDKFGLKNCRRSWDDPNFDWSSTHSVLFRSTWDYFERFNEFSIWLDAVVKQTKLINPESLIRWNLDKHYLNDLSANGIRCAPTRFLERASPQNLAQLHKEEGWTNTVLKPVISGTARHTYKLNPSNLPDHEALFKELNENEAFMLQPFQESIVTTGEFSMVVIDGIFTHAVLKKVKKGDFRVQDDFGGTVHPYVPSKEEIAFAEQVVRTCVPKPLYARVDMFIDNEAQWSMLELELIEPELWFRKYPRAAALLAGAIKRYLKG